MQIKTMYVCYVCLCGIHLVKPEKVLNPNTPQSLKK